MNEDFARPRLAVSRCLGFAACRWNGVALHDDYVEALRPHVEFIDLCPEADIGLGVPRDPLRVVAVKTGDSREPRLLQPATGRDLTATMRTHVDEVLDGLGDVDGFLLKHRSPSCGIKDVKIYSAADQGGAFGRGGGFFGGVVAERCGGLAVEDEGRLNNYRLREHFYTKLFALADLRRTLAEGRLGALMDFQARNKLLLMAYDQQRMRELGRLLAAADSAALGETAARYREEFAKALDEAPGVGPVTNVLLHALGYFSTELGAEEKAFFLELLEGYRTARLPLSAVTSVLGGWIVRHDEQYLARQSFFSPFPPQLVRITDSGKGR
jgi:uncharacterized protein YbgA (DUF1722 family)/uncharacterized protein YbbK (DUF523 family)